MTCWWALPLGEGGEVHYFGMLEQGAVWEYGCCEQKGMWGRRVQLENRRTGIGIRVVTEHQEGGEGWALLYGGLTR